MSRRQQRRRERRRRRARLSTGGRLAAAGGLALGASLVTGATAQATDFVVNTTDDTGDGTCEVAANECTLRDAIDDADDMTGADRVLFQAGLSGTISLSNTLFVVGDGLQILGPGPDQIAVDGHGDYQLFYLDSGDPVTISGLTLTRGKLYGSGGAIRNVTSTLTVSNTVLYDNYGFSAGGAIHASAPTTISGSTFSDNHSYYDGGAMRSIGGDMTIVNSTFSYNTSGYAPNADGGGAISSEYPIAISGSILYRNTSAVAGGAVAGSDSITIAGSDLTGNGAPAGGAISSDGALAVQDSTFDANYASGTFGGAIYARTGDVEVDASTISSNYANQDGGAVYSSFQDYAVVDVQNSTISGNSVGDDGGGIWICCGNDPADRLSVSSSTISGNAAGQTGGGIHAEFNAGDLPGELSNTIVANNLAPDAPDLYEAGAGFDAAFSLVEDSSGATVNTTVAGSNIFGVDPQLGALANNGGPTQTLALAATSPALDKGSSSLTVDQRGFARPSDDPGVPNSAAAGADGSDIGAVEIQFQAVPVVANCKGRTATIAGTDGNDNLTGTSGRDVIAALGGNDKVSAKGGNDLICAGGGKDNVRGNGGKDREFGGSGKDTLAGNGGKDKLIGHRGRDILRGGPGRDRLRGGARRDRLIGGPGDDVLKGGGGTDVLIGGPGTDFEKQ